MYHLDTIMIGMFTNSVYLGGLLLWVLSLDMEILW